MLISAVVPIHPPPLPPPTGGSWVFPPLCGGGGGGGGGVCKFFFIFWIRIPKIIPRTSRPVWHRICFPFCFSATNRTFDIDPFGNIYQRRFSAIRRLIIFYFRQFDWQIFLRHWHHSAFLTMYNRNRLAPVTLSRKNPVAELESDFFFSPYKFYDFFLCFFGIHAIKFARITQNPPSFVEIF